MTFNELMQKYVNYSYEELVTKAREDLEILVPVFEKVTDGKSAELLVPSILTCLAADGKLTALEVRFMEDVLGERLSYDEAKRLVSGFYSDDAQEVLDQLIDNIGTDLKVVLLELCICAMAVDETLDKNELSFIAKLIDE